MPMSPRLLRPRASGDPDAGRYIAAVQAADGQALEPAVRQAIEAFVRGCKADGIWSAIKASCILMGARTLLGALTPLVGTAPTNTNFVSGDYDRKTGLKGGNAAAGKILNSNRKNNADPQDSKHAALYVSQATTIFNYGRFIVAGPGTGGDLQFVTDQFNQTNFLVNLNNSSSASVLSAHTTGFFGLNRSSSSSFVFRQRSSDTTVSRTSATPRNENMAVFCRPGESPLRPVDARIAFYSFGESLTLSLMQSRVETLYNSIGAAIA